MATNSTGFMSFGRMWVIACHTFTQLSRMKVFYFLIVFAILMIGVNFFELPSNSAGANTAEEHLKMIKNMSLWAMEMFALIFGIAATALLIPKDIEDRTLYTILCKPVPRIDYLFGKLLGVLLIILVATLLMDVLFCIVVHVRANGIEAIRFNGIIKDQLEALKASYAKDSYMTEAVMLEELGQRREELEALGVTYNLQLGVLAIYLKSVVVAAVALLLSTFSTSTLFTIIMTVIIYIVGMFQSEAAEAYKQVTEVGDTLWIRLMTGGISVVFPDFQMFNITDSATQASLKPIEAVHIIKMIILAVIYSAIYTILSWFVFRKKEF